MADAAEPVNAADAAPPREAPRRRRRWRLLVVALVVALLAAPEGILLIWSCVLPSRFGPVRLTGLSPIGLAPQAELEASASPGTVATLIHGVSRCWLPPLPLYPGMAAHGRLAIPAPRNLGGNDLGWALRVGLPGAAPTATLRLDPAAADVLLQRWTTLELGMLELRLELSAARLASVDGHGLDCLDLTASGAITIDVNGDTSQVGLDRLAMRITTRFEPVEGGWRPHATAALRPLVVAQPQSAILGTESTRAQVEALINAHLGSSLAHVVVPGWVPRSTRVLAVIGPEAPPASAAR